MPLIIAILILVGGIVTATQFVNNPTLFNQNTQSGLQTAVQAGVKSPTYYKQSMEKIGRVLEQRRARYGEYASETSQVIDRAVNEILPEGLKQADECIANPTDQCKMAVKKIRGKMKTAHGLAKYLSISAGGWGCTKADNGISPHIKSLNPDEFARKEAISPTEAIDNPPEKQYRVFYCRSDNGGSDRFDIRVDTGKTIHSVTLPESWPLVQGSYDLEAYAEKARECVFDTPLAQRCPRIGE